MKARKILSLALGLVLLLGSMALAQEAQSYEVPVKIMSFTDPSKESMANGAIEPIVRVKKTDQGYQYSLGFKPMKVQAMEGSVTKLFVLDGDKKVEGKKTQGSGQYPDVMTFVRSDKDAEITIAVWVDVMDELMGGQPGAGEQKAKLVLDWDKAQAIGKAKEKPAEKPATKDSQAIQIKVDGQLVQSDVAPFIQEGRTLVPVRLISEALGYKVDWDPAKRMVTVDGNIQLTIDSKTVSLKDGSTIEIDVPAQITQDRTFVPIRAIAEILGCKVDWDGDTRTVIVNK